MSGLSLRGLTVERDRRMAVEDVSFTAPAGRLTALLGGRGAGKTTLLAATAGLLPVVRGAVLVAGADVTRQRGASRRGVALLPPGTVLAGSSRAGEALRALSARATEARVRQGLDALGLADLQTRRLRTLTHGEQFGLLAAARLLPDDPVLLMDEAGVGMDRGDRERLLTELRRLAQDGRTVLFATRDDELAQGADHLVLLDAGQVVQAGAPAVCYAEPASAAAALLTGPANILEGTVRERRPGAYVWMAAGTRFLQALTPETVQPPLGSQARFCLRPERVALLMAGEQADNALTGVVTSVRTCGGMAAVEIDTACGVLLVSTAAWPGDFPDVGENATMGWSSGAATVLQG